MSTRFLEALHSGKVLLMDGAMGTELIRRGQKKPYRWWSQSEFPDLDVVSAIHQDYLDAGAQVYLTATFLANQWHRGRRRNLGDKKAQQANVAAAVASARAVCGDRFILGSLGPPTAQTPFPRFAVDTLRCIRAMSAVDGVLLETQYSSSFPEAILTAMAIEGTVSSALLISFALAFDEVVGARCYYPDALHSKTQQRPEDLAAWADRRQPKIAALGVNCGRGMGLDQLIDAVRRYRKTTKLPILVRANAGQPRRVGDEWVYPLTPEQLAARVPELVDAGVTLLGGCCGTTPAHIAAMRDVLDKLGVLWQPAERGT
jgi:5-methyltetrahydrofolate--homocysteine methyltransferase